MALYLKDRQIEHLNNLLTLDIDHVEILRWDISRDDPLSAQHPLLLS